MLHEAMVEQMMQQTEGPAVEANTKGPYADAQGVPVVGQTGSPALRRLQEALEKRAHDRGELSQNDQWVAEQRRPQARAKPST